jgi:UDP:flavonoid glycosyltransferase YjiC (YdhE family)
MKRILLAWEIGEHRGHVLRMADIATRLRAVGVAIAWAALRVDQLDGIAESGEPIFQSPLWPGLHVETLLSQSPRPPVSHADLLADLGLRQPGAFHHILAAWDAILAAVQPEAVFADYAPALLSACRGRIPTVAAGIGFTLPPSHLEKFPRYALPLTADVERADREPELLAEANAGLARVGRPALSYLPEIFGADVAVISSFKELDPFAEHRPSRHAPPSLMNWAPPSRSPGDEIIVYWTERLLNLHHFFDCVAALGMPVRIVAPGLKPEHAARYAGPTLTFEAQPLHFAEIARKARLVICNGNTGFVSAAMLAGLPQALLPHDIQKRLVGQAIETLGVGMSHYLDGIDWPSWQTRVRALYDDEAVRRRASAYAGKLIPRMHREPAETCADALLMRC